MGTVSSRTDTDMAPNLQSSSVHTLSPVPMSQADKQSRRVGHIRATISFYSGVRQLQEIVTTTTNIGPNGGFFYGSANPPAALIEDLADVFKNPPVDSPLRDSKAHQLLVTYCDGWHAIPSPVNFSRHAGTCLLLGDRSNASVSHTIKLGDCFRLGSVGLVVVAMRLGGGYERTINPSELSCIHEEKLYFPVDDDEAFRFIDERQKLKACNQSVRTLQSVDDDGEDSSAGEDAPLCYMCYDPHDDEADPLVAPCDCKGDTRYLHVSCLQRWYSNLGCGPHAVVIRTTANGAPACKICGTAYKTTFRDSSGKKANIVEASHTGPFISFMVVTRHENAPQLFNTKFRLNFRGDEGSADADGAPPYPTEMTIGRSSACNMVLDYRTVSTMHARISYHRGDGGPGTFTLEDLHSSNGTLLYLQRPHLLGPVGSRTILRMGRTTMCLDVRGNALGGTGPSRLGLPSCISCRGADDTFEPCNASPEELHTIMSLSAGASSNSCSPAKSTNNPVDISSPSGSQIVQQVSALISPAGGDEPPAVENPSARDGSRSSDLADVAMEPVNLPTARPGNSVSEIEVDDNVGADIYSPVDLQKKASTAESAPPVMNIEAGAEARTLHSSAVSIVSGAVTAGVTAAISASSTEREHTHNELLPVVESD